MRPRAIPAHLRTAGEEHAVCCGDLEACGWTVFSTSDPQARRATGGILDIIAFKPGRILFWDSKTYKARASKNESAKRQQAFMDAARRAGAEVGWGNADALRNYLTLRVAS